MKRLMFLLVSTFIATTSYCANVSDNIMNVLSNNDETTQIEKQKNQPLVLQKAIDMVRVLLRVTIRTVLILHTVLTARIAHTRLTIQVVTKDSDSQDHCEL